MSKDESTPEVRHEDDITPYTTPVIPQGHFDLDEEVC
jgi:hypothetical protein